MVAGATENPPPTLPMSDSPEPANDEWDDLVELGRYPKLALAQEHGLVVLAMRLRAGTMISLLAGTAVKK